MRPRSFERGKLMLIAYPIMDTLASMRPRSFERGKCEFHCKRRDDRSRFNEAALFRTRKG